MKDRLFEARVIVKHGSKIILSYVSSNPPIKVAEFEKDHLAGVRLLYEGMGFEFELGSPEKAHLSRNPLTEGAQDFSSNSQSSQSLEPSVGCIVC